MNSQSSFTTFPMILQISIVHTRSFDVGLRGKSVRFSPHLHITDNDVDCLLKTLEDLLK